MQKLRVCTLTFFFSIFKLQYRNSISFFNLLLLVSGDTSLNPGPPLNNQLQAQSEWRVFYSRGFTLSTSTLIVCYLKSKNLEIFLNHLMQQLQAFVNQNQMIPFSHLKYTLLTIMHFAVIGTYMGEAQFATRGTV